MKNKELEIKGLIAELQESYIEMSNISSEEDKLQIKKIKAQKRLVLAKENMRSIKFDY
jgi:hypothetical protein